MSPTTAAPHLPTDPAVKSASNPYSAESQPTPKTDVGFKHDPNAVSAEKKIEDLYKLIDGIETAMFTTRNADGSLVSRAMQTRQRTNGCDLWFVTNNQSHKLDDLHNDPHVNIAYYNPKQSSWVSVSGRAQIINDKEKIRSLYAPDLKAWFGDLGDGIHTGGPEDPRITLIFVEAESAHYQMQEKSQPRVLFEVVRGMMTGERAHPGKVREVGKGELHATQ